MQLMYVWGHSYQLNDSNKPRTKAVYEALGNRGDIWYATNIEVANYLKAVDALIIGSDESRNTTVYNPSALPVFVTVDGKCFEIPSNTSKTISVAEPIVFNDRARRIRTEATSCSSHAKTEYHIWAAILL